MSVSALSRLHPERFEILKSLRFHILLPNMTADDTVLLTEKVTVTPFKSCLTCQGLIIQDAASSSSNLVLHWNLSEKCEKGSL